MGVPTDGPDRVVCPQCDAKIRVRRNTPQVVDPDNFIRFSCPCGRRLKVKAEGIPRAGKCPDCGRVVPVPASTSSGMLPTSHPEASTEELSAADRTMIEEWSQRHLSRAASVATPAAAATIREEAGLRVCPRCRRPVHMGAVACRECGTHVPKR